MSPTSRPAPPTLPVVAWWQLSLQAWEVAVTAPLVVGHRLARMAVAGANPSARDRREFTRMGQEKVTAGYESMAAMATACAGAGATTWAEALDAGLRLATGGFAPVHSRVMANGRRLGRPRR
ncbi:MAG TPA: hypothetical protein VGQ80_16325 [Acidimicrobiia bacterium]|nr:hypothetical protein [Acidimicrobiia bacterium]